MIKLRDTRKDSRVTSYRQRCVSRQMCVGIQVRCTYMSFSVSSIGLHEQTSRGKNIPYLLLGLQFPIPFSKEKSEFLREMAGTLGQGIWKEHLKHIIVSENRKF